MWRLFIAVNLRIVDFTDWKSKVTIVNLFGWVGAIGALFGAVFGIFDWLVPWLIKTLTGKPDLAGAWVSGDHWIAKSISALLVVAFFYLIVFCFQATVLLVEREATVAVVAVVPDYRPELAKAIGISHTRVRDYYNVKNLNGDCYVILEADFQVGTLPVAHMERKCGSSSALSRKTVGHEAQLNPKKSEILKTADYKGNPHVYHFRFVPPLTESGVTCQTRITEDMSRGIWMYVEDVKFDPVIGGNMESVGHLVQSPTDHLELEVRFPVGYQVTADRFFKVRLGTTESAHEKEEERLRIEKCLKPGFADDQQFLKLVVEKPIMGLSYFLCWRPPNKP